MTNKKISIAPELIFSHYWGEVSAKPRLTVMHVSFGALLDKIGNPGIKINDSTIIERLLNSCAHWFSMNLSITIIKQIKKYKNLNFEDLTFLIALSYNFCMEIETTYVESLIEKYFSRKITGITKGDPLFPEITNNMNGLLAYREQAEKLITHISGITEEKAHILVRNLGKCDAEARSFGHEFVKSGVSNGYEESEVCKIWKFISLRSQFLLDYDFSLALGWLLYQIEYLKTYYSYVMNGEIESFEKSYDITPILNTIKQKHNITSF